MIFVDINHHHSDSMINNHFDFRVELEFYHQLYWEIFGIMLEILGGTKKIDSTIFKMYKCLRLTSSHMFVNANIKFSLEHFMIKICNVYIVEIVKYN